MPKSDLRDAHWAWCLIASKWVADLLLVVVSLLAPILGIVAITSANAAVGRPNGDDWRFSASIAGLVIFVVAQGIRLFFTARETIESHRKSALVWIYPILELLHEALLRARERDDAEANHQIHDLRICLHQTERGGGERLIQFTEYVMAGGQRTTDKAGRPMSRKSGVVGAAIAGQGVVTATLRDGADRQAFLCDFNYERHEIRDLDPDTRSFAAYRIGEPDQPHYVLFCDAKTVDFFGRKGSIRCNLLRSAGLSLARQLKRR